MSARVRSRSRSRGRDGREASPDAPVAVSSSKRGGGRKSQREKPKTVIPNIKPEEEKEKKGVTAIKEEPGVEGDGQKVDPKKTGDERGDGPDVKEKTPPNIKPKVSGAGDEK